MGKNKAGAFFAVLQKIGQALMMPVSVLPAAGLMVALGRVMQSTLPIAEQTGITKISNAFGNILFSGGLAIFEQLPVVFAIGVAIGFTGGAGVAGLASVVGYFTFVNVIKVMGDVRGLELAINTGVFGGIIIGLLTANLYKRFHETKLHPVLGFFSGKRLVPIVTAGGAILTGLLLAFIWPPIQDQIKALGEFAMSSNIGPALYAAGKRLLIPVGLHHVYYPSFLFEFGEYVTTAGKVVHGDSARYFAGDPTAGRFMASEYPLMLFGLPAAALAMVLRARPDKRKAIAGMMFTAALTSIITGITEPIEFAFIFVAPALFVFHVMAAFTSGLLTNLFDLHLGYTFSASAIDFLLGFFNQKNSMMLFTLIGPAIALTYFSVFYWAIGKFDFKTPGREATDALAEAEESTGPVSDRAGEILEALGGGSNIAALDACITRLRLSVRDITKVNKVRLKQLGAAGIMDAGSGNLQVIFGVESDLIKEQIKTLMKLASLNSIFLKSPMKGSIVALKDVPDQTFAEKILGEGIAFDPTEGAIYAPIDCEVVQIFRTNHAVGLRTAAGLEILIHIGIDTVKMDGHGFKAFVKNGDFVKAGDKLIEFDLDLVKKEAKSIITPMVVTNSADYKSFTVLKSHNTIPSDRILEIKI